MQHLATLKLVATSLAVLAKGRYHHAGGDPPAITLLEGKNADVSKKHSRYPDA